MKDNPVRYFVGAFLIALAGYVILYQAIEHRRYRRGPWEVVFTNGATSEPVLLINQHALSLTNVQVSFPGEPLPATNFSASWDFAAPRPVPYEVPFGRCLFMDTTFLPGTLTLQLYGHEIELLPRTLIIDHKECPWRSGETIPLPRNPPR
jgi:hypothetical protein